jgi:hypothetical protein
MRKKVDELDRDFDQTTTNLEERFDAVVASTLDAALDAAPTLEGGGAAAAGQEQGACPKPNKTGARHKEAYVCGFHNTHTHIFQKTVMNGCVALFFWKHIFQMGKKGKTMCSACLTKDAKLVAHLEACSTCADACEAWKVKFEQF